MLTEVRKAIREKSYETALTLLEEETGASRDGFEYHRTKGMVLAQLSRQKEAVQHYETAVQMKRDDAAIHNELGKLFYKMKRFPDAVSKLEEARRLSNSKIGCIVSYTKSLERVGRGEEAERILRQHVANNPNSADPRYNLALRLFEKGFADEAIVEMQRAIAISPDSFKYLVFLGQILGKSERHEEAETYLRKADEMTPEATGHLIPFGNALERMHRYDEATAIFQRALANPKLKTGALTRLVDIHTATGDHGAAVAGLAEIMADEGEQGGPRGRRLRIHAQILGDYNEEEKRRLAESRDYFESHKPNLDTEQARILDEIVDKGICMSTFEDLFGADFEQMWNEAEAQVAAFRSDPATNELANRIEQCPDFNADPFFAGNFKPSIVNYKMLKGEIKANDPIAKFYYHPRILNIANHYNGMLSKVRNVALWLNPPIGGKNVGERKGSQIWHRDQEDIKILKCFIYYTNVDEGSGATEYIPFSKTDPVRKYSHVLPYPYSSGYPGKYLINKHIDPKDFRMATGRKRSIMFFDTNGFHRGGYATKGERIISMCTYLRPLTPYADTNLKLNQTGFNREDQPHEARYGVE